ALLAEVRRSVFEAVHSAMDKPRIWRAVWRIAVRRPIVAEPAKNDELDQDDEIAKKWLFKVVKQYAEAASEEKVRPASLADNDEISRWQAVWPVFRSFQRSAIWRSFA